MLDIAEALVGSVKHGRERARARAVQWWHQRRGNRPNIAAPLRRLERVLQALARRAHGLFVRLFPARSRLARPGASAEARSHLPQADAAAGRGISRHRLRLGRADLPCRAGVRRQGDRHHAVAKSVRSRTREDRRARPRRSRAGRTARLPRPARGQALRQDRQHRHVRARRHPQLSALLRQDPRDPEARRPGAQSRHHLEPVRRRQPRQRHQRFRRGIRLPRRAARPRFAGDRGHRRDRPRTDRRRAVARALCAHALALGRAAGTQCRRRSPRSRRGEIPHLANLSRGFGPCIRPRLAVDLPASCRQAASPTAACRIR